MVRNKRTLASFRVKIFASSDTKKLKGGKKVYRYGAISIRDPKLNDYVGQDVLVKILKIIKKEKV